MERGEGTSAEPAIGADGGKLEAHAIIREIKRAGVRFVAALPDATTSHVLLRGLLADSDLRVVQVCKEDEGVGVCSGLYCAGERALLLMQETGLLDSLNAVRGTAVENEFPVCMMVGLLGKERGVAPTRSKQYGVRIVEPILDAMGVRHQLVEEPEDVARIVPAIEDAYGRLAPVAILIGQEPR
ncbi:MAG TPA: decarboxylase [Chloroflexota bacterium]|nr:decarboxylase [Chloroflexota bacterium]